MATKTEVDILLQFRSDLQGVLKANTALRTLTGAIGGVRNILAGFGVGIGVGSLAAIARSSMQLAGNITDLAAAANIGTQALQTLGALGAESGVKLEEVSKVLVALQRSIEEASTGNKALAASFSQLGLSAAGLRALAPERQLEMVARAILNAKDQTAAFNAAMDVLGSKNAPKLRAMLEALARDGFDKVSEATKNLRISGADLKTLDDAGDKLDAIWQRMKVIAAQGVLKIAAVVEAGGTQGKEQPGLAGTFGGGGLLGIGYDAGRRNADNLRRSLPADDGGGRDNDLLKNAVRKDAAQKNAVDAEYNKAKAIAAAEAERVAAEAAEKVRYAENQKARELRMKLNAENRAAAEKAAKEEAEAVAKARAVASTEADRALGNATFAIDLQRQRIENDTTTTVAQKKAALLPLYAEENALIAKRIALLELELQMEKDPAAKQSLQGRIDALQQRTAGNVGAAQQGRTLGFGDQLSSDISRLQEQWGTAVEAMSRMTTNTLGLAVQGVSDTIYGALTRTRDWGQIWLSVGATALKQLIDMGVQQAILFAKGLFFTKANATAQAQAGAQIAASNAPAAAATSISSYGGAAVAGMVAAGIAVGAIIAMLASGGFAQGGRISGPGTSTSDSIPIMASNDEFMIRAAAARAIGYENLAYANRHGRMPAATGGASAPVSSAGSSARPVVVNLNLTADQIRSEMFSGASDAHFVDMWRRNQWQLG